MAIRLDVAGYTQLNNSIGDLLRSGTCSSVLMNIHTNSSATAPLVDGNGPVIKRQISSVNVVQEHTDQTTGIKTNGYVTVVFADGSSVVSTESVDQYWYVLETTPYQPRRFNNLA
jgi:hypothetical protein